MKNIIYAGIVLLLVSSCTGTVHKMYEGDLLDANKVAFVTTSVEVSICSVNGQEFETKVPGIKLCHQNIELIAPQIYTIKAWDNYLPQSYDNTKIIQLDAEAGKLYLIDAHRDSHRKWDATITEVTDSEEIKNFQEKFTNGKLKRQPPQPVIGK